MAERIVNINVGILGHVDSGKTSLAKALSTLQSTASFDRSPQSQTRGITLDLGFSAFLMPAPEAIADQYDKVQYTLVDCPGHASLIKTIIGGAQIIDMMILVIDITEGIQTQTAECLVIGNILMDSMIVVLNKIDLLPADKRAATIKKMTARLRKTLAAKSKFGESPIIPISTGQFNRATGPENLSQLIDTIQSSTRIPHRLTDGDFVFAIDHCFPIKGQGTVITGTVLSGSVSQSDMIEFPAQRVQKKIKSMQMFKKPVTSARQGDRVGMCIAQLDANTLERGIACSPGAVIEVPAAVVAVKRVAFFKRSINSRGKFHITIGHQTALASIQVFGTPGDVRDGAFDFDREYQYQEELLDANTLAEWRGADAAAPSATSSSSGDAVPAAAVDGQDPVQYALLEFESPIICPRDSMLIGSRMDTDIVSKNVECRLAFYGKMVATLNGTTSEELSRLKIRKWKERRGTIDRVMNATTLLGKGLFKKETDMSIFQGLTVVREPDGDEGTIEGSFGKSGKFKINFPNGTAQNTQGEIVLRYKTFLYKSGKGQKKLIQ